VFFYSGGLDLFINELGVFYFVAEIANFGLLALILIVFTHYKIIEKDYFLFWIIYFLSPFLFNFVLFSPYYFGDQYTYLDYFNRVKRTGLIEGLQYVIANDGSFEGWTGVARSRTLVASYLLTFIPLFSVLTVTSLAFANKFLVLLLFIFLRKRFEAREIIAFLLIPSFILYTSLSLREPLIMFFGVIALVLILENRPISSLACLLVLGILKIQNAPAFFVIWIFIFLLRAQVSYIRISFYSLIGIAVIIATFGYYGDLINLYRLAFAMEDGVPLGEVELLEIQNGFDMVYTTIREIPGFLLAPLPWQVKNPFQAIMSIESICLVIALCYLVFRKVMILDKRLLIFLLGFGICMGIHAVTASNFGTLARYRFGGFFPFLIAFYYIYRTYRPYAATNP
jgi:hypothetical protein